MSTLVANASGSRIIHECFVLRIAGNGDCLTALKGYEPSTPC